jgi:hypothetical protein
VVFCFVATEKKRPLHLQSIEETAQATARTTAILYRFNEKPSQNDMFIVLTALWLSVNGGEFWTAGAEPVGCMPRG